MDNKKEDRGFKGIWIPKEVWINKNLTVMEKIALVEINSYDNDFGCVASNSTLSKSMNIKPNTFGNLIRSLESKGYIKTSYNDMRCYSGRVINVFKDKYFGITSTHLENQEPPLENQEPPLENQEPPLENQEHSNSFSNSFSKGLNLNAETSSADVKDLFGNEVKVANGIKSKPAKKKKESTAHPSHVEIKKYWYEEFSVGERFHPGAGKFINNIIANIESYISSMGGDTSPEKITEFFKVVCNQKILSKNSFVATAGLNVLSSPTNFKTIINSIENNGKSINQTGNRAGVTNFKFGYADPRKQQRQSDML